MPASLASFRSRSSQRIGRRLACGVVSIGNVVKDTVCLMGQQIGFLETYIKDHGR